MPKSPSLTDPSAEPSSVRKTLAALRSRCRICFECMCCSAPPSCWSQLITVSSAKGARLSAFCRSWIAPSTLPREANSITMLSMPSDCEQ
eukprot:scaffold1007_cov61-Phaeocystis_antarctica.AAC.9